MEMKIAVFLFFIIWNMDLNFILRVFWNAIQYFGDVKLMGSKHQCDYYLNDGYFHENLAIHLNNSFKNSF